MDGWVFGKAGPTQLFGRREVSLRGVGCSQGKLARVRASSSDHGPGSGSEDPLSDRGLGFSRGSGHASLVPASRGRPSLQEVKGFICGTWSQICHYMGSLCQEIVRHS